MYSTYKHLEYKAFLHDTNIYTRKRRIREYTRRKGKPHDFEVRSSELGCVRTKCKTCRPPRGKEAKMKSNANRRHSVYTEIKDQLNDIYF